MYHLYNKVLAGLLLALLAGGLIATALLDPLDGDLTRLGGYSENRFGWTLPQARFAPPLATPGGRDIVVIGDSFSSATSPDRAHRAGMFWTDHLAARTGLAVGVFAIATTPLGRLLDTLATAPPRLVVLEVVERGLGRLPMLPGICVPAPSRLADLPRAAATAAREFARPRAAWPDPARLGEALGQLGTSLERLPGGRDINKVRQRPLSRVDLFSSADPATLLFYNEDLDRRAWTEADWATIACRIRAIQAAVRARLGAAFLVLVAPDKSSAYAPYLPAADRPIDAIARLAALPDLPLVRADLALRRLIDAGTRDVYLPNDTHWGSAGAAAAAEAVLAHGR